MNRKDWNLLVIAGAEGQPLTPVQLQKCLFILGKEAEIEENYYYFIPYNYGPFCGEIYDDARELAEEGLVLIRPVPGQSWSEYSITPEGTMEARRIRSDLPKEIADFINLLVSWAHGLSFQDLVRAVYDKYPEYKKNSVFVD